MTNHQSLKKTDGGSQKNSYSQSARHFWKDFRNMAGGFMSNRMDKVKHTTHQMKEKAKTVLQKLVSSFKKFNLKSKQMY